MKSKFLRGSLLATAALVACAMATPASAKARHSAKTHQDMVPWHGWGQSFHYNGVRYAGGNRRGPAASYNNWEGGFHPTVFWMIKDAERT
jgi:hypothetical protein